MQGFKVWGEGLGFDWTEGAEDAERSKRADGAEGVDGAEKTDGAERAEETGGRAG